MIRVNLAKTHNYTSTGTQTAIAMDQAAAKAAGAPHPAVKVGLMVLMTILLYVYESYNLSQLRVRLAEKNEQVRQIQAEVQQFGPVSGVVEGLVKERQKLNSQLAVIQQISRKRSFKLRAIRQVQESVLEDLWLTEMIVKRDSLVFRGLSRSPTSVQQIVKNLLAADFVETAINRELKRVKSAEGEMNSFDIEAKVKQ